MEQWSLLDVGNLEKSEEFLQSFSGIRCVDEFLNEFMGKWLRKWTDFDDIALDVRGKIDIVCEAVILKSGDERVHDLLRVSVECIILNKLHDCVIPLIYFQFDEEDNYFFNKCKDLSDSKITAEQFGAPDDYAIPLTAAVVELASLDGRCSPVEKIHCLCTTYDLVFAELKSAIIEIISRSTDKDNEIPVIENYDIIPVLMTVIARAKLLHMHSNLYYMENFLWKLKESETVTTTISVFRSSMDKIYALTEENLQPGCDKVCRDLDLAKVMEIMTELEAKRKKQDKSVSLLDQHTERVSDLIYASTFANVT